MGQVRLLDKHWTKGCDHLQPRPPPPHPSMSIHAKAEDQQQDPHREPVRTDMALFQLLIAQKEGAGVEVGCQLACRCLVTVAGVKQVK